LLLGLLKTDLAAQFTRPVNLLILLVLRRGQAIEMETPAHMLWQLEPLRRSQATEIDPPAHMLWQLEPLCRSQAIEVEIPAYMLR